MRLSRFNQYVPDAPEPGETLVHNTLAGSYAVLANEELELLRRVDRGEAPASAAAELITECELDAPDVGVVVSSYEAEEQEFLEWFEFQRSQIEVMEVTVGVNLACNFACTYCCQAEIMDGSVMKLETCDQTADWLASRATEAGVQSLFAIFIGGEPLLHPGRVERIATQIREKLEGTGIPFSFGLTTNGLFLDAAMLDRLIPLGLTRAQITLDGNHKTHKLTRVSKKGEDSYRTVFDHAIAASKRIEVKLNGNYTPQTIDGFVPLLEELKSAGLPCGTRVSFTPALEGLASPKTGALGATWSESPVEVQAYLRQETEHRGYEAPELGVVGPCEFHEHHSFAIDPSGTLYKCPGFLGEPNWGIGHVASGLVEDRYSAFVASTPQKSCDGCSHRPNCGGGCVAAAMLENGRLEGVRCEKDHLDRVSRRYEPTSRADQLQFPTVSRRMPGGHVRTTLPVL